jgi:hypothetical protein
MPEYLEIFEQEGPVRVKLILNNKELPVAKRYLKNYDLSFLYSVDKWLEEIDVDDWPFSISSIEMNPSKKLLTIKLNEIETQAET